jgi:ABC-type transporter Mla maintaining outer membrane lipid asymmetry ATPase subunit MlaF
MPPAESAVSLKQVIKDYRGLRPLRVAALDVPHGRTVALLGFDQAMAEVLVKLIMGASLPDTGEVIVFGESTAAITDGDIWLKGLDRFALLGDRALLVEQLTAEQSIAMPISFDLDEPTGEVRRTVERVALEVGFPSIQLSAPVGTLGPLERVRVRLARALVNNPQLLLAEHPTASLSADDTGPFAADFARVVRGRSLTALVLTADRRFADAVGDDVRTLQPATGQLAATGWRRWFNS